MTVYKMAVTLKSMFFVFFFFFFLFFFFFFFYFNTLFLVSLKSMLLKSLGEMQILF